MSRILIGGIMLLVTLCVLGYSYFRLAKFELPKVPTGNYLTVSACLEKSMPCTKRQIRSDSAEYSRFKNWILENSQGWRIDFVSRPTRVLVTSENYQIFLTGENRLVIYNSFDEYSAQYRKEATEEDVVMFFGLASPTL